MLDLRCVLTILPSFMSRSDHDKLPATVYCSGQVLLLRARPKSLSEELKLYNSSLVSSPQSHCDLGHVTVVQSLQSRNTVIELVFLMVVKGCLGTDLFTEDRHPC